jgi:hypothetical protein
MNIRQRLVGAISKTELGRRMIREQPYRIILSATVALFLNLLYALYHGIIGVAHLSLWFVTMSAYYTILGSMRFVAVVYARKRNADTPIKTIIKMSGILLILLSFVLSGVIYISLSQNIASKYDEITMITIATYIFGKITITVIKAVKQHKSMDPILKVIRNISYAEVTVSVLTLQRSMIVSFGGMTNAYILNALSGAAGCLFILSLGIAIMTNGFQKGRMILAKSKLIKINEKIEHKVVGAFEKVEDTVVGGYTKIEDAFVERYLTKDHETVEEAKKRLKGTK